MLQHDVLTVAFLSSLMPEKSSVPFGETFLHAGKVLSLELGLALYGPDFSGMGECKKNSVGGGKNVPVLTAGFYIVGNTFFRCEGK
jgi:hypothetical protein